MLTREEERLASAAYLNALSRDELFDRYAITRIAKIDGLDAIGIPVYSCVRPASRTLSVSAGKSRNPEMARAGAIAEAIEFHTFENPRGPYVMGQTPLPLLPTMAGVEFCDSTLLLVEPATKLRGGPTWFPSEMLWMVPRERDQRLFFMKSTNGQALGISVPDAFLAGLYECVERDQVGLWRISQDRLGTLPPRVRVPDKLREIEDRCQRAGLLLYLYNCQLDIPLASYCAILIDPIGGVGTFLGWGCHLSDEIAAERAMLEAVQSRAVYISGARDDITRHQFLSNRESDPAQFILNAEQAEVFPFPIDYTLPMSVTEELTIVLGALKPWQDQVFYREVSIDAHLVAVKTFILGLEQPNISGIIKGWRSTRWETLRLMHQALDLNQATIEFLTPLIKPGMRVLDVGCGAGDVSLICSHLGAVVTGIDIDGDAIAQAMKRVPGGTFIRGKIEYMDHEEEYDAIVGRLILMHLADARLETAKLYSLLSPEGIMAFQETFDLTTFFPKVTCQQIKDQTLWNGSFTPVPAFTESNQTA